MTKKEQAGFDTYSAGMLSDFGGGDVGWWQDYVRAELGHAHDFYKSQAEAAQEAFEERIRVLKREKLELTRVYEERGRQIERLEVALTRATEGSK